MGRRHDVVVVIIVGPRVGGNKTRDRQSDDNSQCPSAAWPTQYCNLTRPFRRRVRCAKGACKHGLAILEIRRGYPGECGERQLTVAAERLESIDVTGVGGRGEGGLIRRKSWAVNKKAG